MTTPVDQPKVSPNNLFDLNVDCLLAILSNLNISDLYKFSAVCRTAYQIVQPALAKKLQVLNLTDRKIIGVSDTLLFELAPVRQFFKRNHEHIKELSFEQYDFSKGSSDILNMVSRYCTGLQVLSMTYITFTTKNIQLQPLHKLFAQLNSLELRDAKFSCPDEQLTQLLLNQCENLTSLKLWRFISDIPYPNILFDCVFPRLEEFSANDVPLSQQATFFDRHRDIKFLFMDPVSWEALRPICSNLVSLYCTIDSEIVDIHNFENLTNLMLQLKKPLKVSILIKAIAAKNNLRTLTIWGLDTEEIGLFPSLICCKQLTSLDIRPYLELNDHRLRKLAENLPNLQRMAFYKIGSFTPAGLVEFIKNSVHLKLLAMPELPPEFRTIEHLMDIINIYQERSELCLKYYIYELDYERNDIDHMFFYPFMEYVCFEKLNMDFYDSVVRASIIDVIVDDFFIFSLD